MVPIQFKKKDTKIILTSYRWEFDVHWLTSRLIAKGNSIENENIGNRGKLLIKNGFVFLNAEGIHFGENIMLILKPDYPIEVNEKMQGLGTGLTYHKTPFSAKIAFTKKQLNEYDKMLLKKSLSIFEL